MEPMFSLYMVRIMFEWIFELIKEEGYTENQLSGLLNFIIISDYQELIKILTNDEFTFLAQVWKLLFIIKEEGLKNIPYIIELEIE